VLNIFKDVIGSVGEFSPLRTIRLLRPLRSLNKVKGLRVLVKSFIYSIPPLSNVMVFLIFIISVFATFGLHMFKGAMEWRCRMGSTPNMVSKEWPILKSHPYLCDPTLSEGQKYNVNVRGFCPYYEVLSAGQSAGSGTQVKSYCGSPYDYWEKNGGELLTFDHKELDYPEFNYNITGFDTFQQSFISVLQSMTGEGWTDIMYMY
jgi:hypothetical protein